MLSRVANSLFWMSRYIERAENTARIVDVNLQLLLDFRNLDDRRLAEYWVPIVQSTGDEALFAKLYNQANGQTVTDFLVFRQENPNSIISAVAQASASAQVRATTVTEAGDAISGAPRVGSIVCDRRRPWTSTQRR